MGGKASPLFQEALQFAASAHASKNQERKGTDFPYVSHFHGHFIEVPRHSSWRPDRERLSERFGRFVARN
jgi:hypothetical protein